MSSTYNLSPNALKVAKITGKYLADTEEHIFTDFERFGLSDKELDAVIKELDEASLAWIDESSDSDKPCLYLNYELLQFSKG